MEAFNRMLYDDIIKKTDVQYTIPVYQRNYTWEKEHCDQLYNDIINSIKLDKNHFLGSLVYSTTKRNDIKSCPVIDGQQRLTTVMLLLKAIDDLIDDPENITKKKIRKNLYNELCEERYKLKLKNSDNDNTELEKVLMGNNDSLDKTSKVVINFNHFKNRIKRSIDSDGISFEDLLNGIAKLEIVEIVLDANDEPQKIFESINSTGVKLTTADLIRNFLLMGILDPGVQAEIYKNYWVTLDNLINKENIEKFFYDFLVMKDTKYIEEKRVYENFKEYYSNYCVMHGNNVEEIFKEIVKFSKYYNLIVCNNSEDYSKETNMCCSIFNVLQHSTIYPFLLNVCDDFSDIQKLYDKQYFLTNEERQVLLVREAEFNSILKLFGNYALRRNIAEVPSSSLRRFYAALYNRVFGKNKSNKECYYKALEAYLCTLKTSDKMPNDNVFIEGLHSCNMYRRAKILRYFFDIIENKGKEPIDMSNLTIEHILPETLSNQWINDLGERYQEVYDRYVHTLGNLSITGYNSEYSNATFTIKKQKYNELVKEEKTKVVILNHELSDNEIVSWGEDEIKNRAKRLSEIIVNKFPYPVNIDTSLEFEKFYEFYIDDVNDDGDEFVNSSVYKLYGFQFDGVKYKSDSFRDIYRNIIAILYKIDSSILDDMALNKETYAKGTRVLFSKEKDNDYMDEIFSNLYVYTNYNRNSIFEWIRELLERYQIDIMNFCILFVDNE